MRFGMADQSARVHECEIFLGGFALFGIGPLTSWSTNVFVLLESRLNVPGLRVRGEDAVARARILNQYHNH